ncbi:hypothetical protein [Enterobacter ludwigii]|uniref:hypothetical protein n=1 Tax=Enterobacter ludwigii TaxID=299767 RepID=UPI002A82BC08|nr:hypothetical protein [Enterobacter ludwigii]
MSRKAYWILNAVWQVFMYGVMQAYFLYESHTFDYSFHYKAKELWGVGAYSALAYAIVYYILMEINRVFPNENEGVNGK